MNKCLLMRPTAYTDLIPISAMDEVCRPGHSYGPNRKQNTSFHFVLSGTGTFTKGGKTYTLHAGEGFYIGNDDFVAYAADRNDPWRYAWIGFRGSAAERFRALSSPVFRFPVPQITALFVAMEEQEEHKEELAIAGLFTMLATLLPAQPKQNDYVQTVCNYISYNFQKKIRIEEIAKSIGLNRHYLTALFQAERGCSIRDYLIETRLSRAYTFLEQNCRVGEAAQMAGYTDVFAFSRAFKKKYGFSPAKVRSFSDGQEQDREKRSENNSSAVTRSTNNNNPKGQES